MILPKETPVLLEVSTCEVSVLLLAMWPCGSVLGRLLGLRTRMPGFWLSVTNVFVPLAKPLLGTSFAVSLYNLALDLTGIV
jgi:hypothetical protein